MQVDVSGFIQYVNYPLSGARRGLFYRPVKQQLTLRIDADIIDWFRRHAKGGRGYQTDINRALRAYVRAREAEKTRGG